MSKVWFITGASRGIGAEIAKAALLAGDRVVATGRRVSALTQSLGGNERLQTIALDVTRPEQSLEAVALAVERFGRIDYLVNNAGYGLIGALEEVSSLELELQFRTNVFGVAAVTRAVLPVMREQRSGHIFNLSSAAGIAGFPGASAYCASKFAVEGLSEALAHEVSPFGIKLTIVEPGYFRTDFLSDDSAAYAKTVIEAYDATAGEMRKGSRSMNGKQAGDPRKLAEAILALAKEEHPPLRFNAGADSVSLMEQTLDAKRKELTKWKGTFTDLAHAQ